MSMHRFFVSENTVGIIECYESYSYENHSLFKEFSYLQFFFYFIIYIYLYSLLYLLIKSGQYI